MTRGFQTLLTFILVFSLYSFTVYMLDTELENRLNDVSNGVGKAFFILPEETDFSVMPQDPLNPITFEKVALGKLLFHETGLLLQNVKTEGRQTNSCAGCHFAEKGFFANRHQGIGEGGVGFENRQKNPNYLGTEIDVQPIRPPASLNLGYQQNVLWNGAFGATGLNAGTEALWGVDTPVETNFLGYEGPEIQAIAGLEVHRMLVNKDVVEQLGYKELFDLAFPDVPVATRYDREHAGLAIASYDRTILANEAPFQEWLRGNNAAMTDLQKEGAILFFGQAECFNCHSGPALNKMEFHAIGLNDLYQHPLEVFQADSSTDVNLGRSSFTLDPTDNFKFKTAQLYNLKDNPHLGHGSSIGSVREMVEYKNAGVGQNPNVPVSSLSPLFHPLNLSPTQIDALVDFVENGLYDPNLLRYKPERILSWLSPSLNDSQAQTELDYPSYCNTISIEGGNGSITLANLDAPIREVAVYDQDFNSVFYCTGDCDETTIINDLPAGDYFVSAKFYSYNWQFICEAFELVTVAEGPVLGPENDCTALTFDGSDGQITIGGVNGILPAVQVFDPAWNTVFSCWAGACGQGTIVVPNLPAGNYHLRFDYYDTDYSVFCSDFKPVTVTSDSTGPVTCLIDVSFTESINCGAASGMLTASASGGTAPYQYAWGTATASQGEAIWTAPGTYALTVVDATGCQIETTGTLNPPQFVQPNLTQNGSLATVNPTGGQAPYVVKWVGSNGYFNWGPLSVNNLAPDTYTATIYDANWCSIEVVFNVNILKTIDADLIDLQAFNQKGDVKLNWVLQGLDVGQNVDIQRAGSVDTSPETIFSVKDYGIDGDYRFFEEIDVSPLDGNNFYRLVFTAKDGVKTRTDWEFIHIDMRPDASIFPNPVHSQAILQLGEGSTKAVDMRISNAQGRVVASKRVFPQSDQIALDFNGFEKGIYFVSIQETGLRPQVVKVIVE